MRRNTQTALLAIAALCAGLLGTPIAAFAQNSGRDLDQLVKQATHVADEMKADQALEALAKHARGIVIVPTMDKGRRGVLLTKHDYTWSDPAFLSIGALSLGARAGDAAGQTVMLLMTQKAVEDFSQADHFSLDAGAGLLVVDDATTQRGSVGKSDIVVWSKNAAAFAGSDVSVANITVDAQADASFYGPHATKQNILHADMSQKKAVGKLRAALPV